MGIKEYKRKPWLEGEKMNPELYLAMGFALITLIAWDLYPK